MGADTRENVDHLVKDLIGHTLSKNNISVQGFVNNPRPTPLEAQVRRTVDALIDDSPELFTNLGEQLHITDENIQHIFVGISDEIFVTGINWGRIVAFLAFGGAVATHCATKEDLKSFVDAVAEWMTEYINANLKQWIERKGGWDGFIKFFRLPGEQENRLGKRDLMWSMAALAGFGIGALLMRVVNHPHP